MEAILACYCDLSPENLTCDGELPRGQALQRGRDLTRKLQHLFKALGRPVSESVAYQWGEEKRKFEKEQEERRKAAV
jgi:hypothetical protein